jgi:hypothetical protein
MTASYVFESEDQAPRAPDENWSRWPFLDSRCGRTDAESRRLQAAWLLQRALCVGNPIVVYCLAAQASVGAPSFELFGAFFPAWLLCGLVGIAGAIIARVVFVKAGLAQVLPYQLAVCTALGSVAALLLWLDYFA